jgi:hypothetical protein
MMIRRLWAPGDILRHSGTRIDVESLWQMEKTKTTKKESRKYTYWMATRRRRKTRNVHLGSCDKVGADEARQKAHKLESLALDRLYESGSPGAATLDPRVRDDEGL